MKRMLFVAPALVTAALLTGCMATTSSGQASSVGDYAMGDDSAAIKKGRNRASAQVSRAELDQHRRQRTNTSEELDLEAKKRRNKQDEIDGSLGTVNRGIGVISNLRGLVGW